MAEVLLSFLLFATAMFIPIYIHTYIYTSPPGDALFLRFWAKMRNQGGSAFCCYLGDLTTFGLTVAFSGSGALEWVSL